MQQLVVMRHGESEWNKQNRFTGWVDVPLTAKGCQEADQAGRLLKDRGYSFDLAYTSLQRRAINTLWRVLDLLELQWIPVVKHWRINERHYGALQGLNKAETLAKHGADQVKQWRRSFDVPPPKIDERSVNYPGRDPRYATIDPALMPVGESLKEVIARVKPYWQHTVLPDLQIGKRVLISAHGNSLRALAMLLMDMSKEEIIDFNIPTGEPMVFTVNSKGKATDMEFVNDPQTIKNKQQTVADQAGGSKDV